MNHYEEKLMQSVKDAVKKVNRLRADDSLVFLIYTDLHTNDIGYEYTNRLLSALSLITEDLEYNAVINLGDNFSMLGRDIHISNEELESRFKRLLLSVYDAAKHPLINVNGNHDAIGTDFFKPDFWRDIVKDKYGNTMGVYDNEGCYYYIDYEKTNTRLIVLSIPHDSDTENEMPTPLWSFGKKQLNWLRQTALADSKNVIILSHVPFYYKYTGDKEATLGVWTGSEAKVSYISALCGRIDDVDEAAEIIEQYNARSDTKLVACFSGHTHTDSLWAPYEEKDEMKNPLPCYQIVTTSTCPLNDAEAEFGISIDIVVWTPSSGEINMIRIGDGEDRQIKL